MRDTAATGRPSVSPAGVFAGAVLTASAASACMHPRAAARQYFESLWPCAWYAEAVTEQVGRQFEPDPPPRGDAARAAEWVEDVARARAVMALRPYYVVEGCGHREHLRCATRPEPGGQRTECRSTSPRTQDPDLDARGAPSEP